MKTKILLALLFCATLAQAQTDLVYPWVTNNSLFRSKLVVNNLGDQTATVTLTASRQSGNSPDTETQSLDVGPFNQVVIDANNLFTTLGEGSGYTVRLTSDASNITGGFVITGTDSPSGSSPSQANVFAASDASNIVLFNFLSISSDGFSSPVVVNMGASSATVTFRAFQDGLEVANTQQSLDAGRPLALLSSDLFIGISGDIYVVAESDQPILGVAFIFNTSREPSMANAVSISSVPNPDGGGGGDPVSFMGQVQPIFNNSCGNGLCHLNGQAANGLNLDASNSYDNIVSVPANAPGFSLNLIEPGSPENSYLYRKLLNSSDADYFGGRMPANRPALAESNIQLIRDWITQGAQNN